MACTDDDAGRPDDPVGADRRGPNPGPLPTIPGGVALEAVDPAAGLVGDALAYGTPLPSEQVAAEALTEAPEVASVVARRVIHVPDARHLADVVLATLDGSELFDEGSLAAFERALAGSLSGGGDVTDVDLAGRPALLAVGEEVTVVAHREGSLLTLVQAPSEADARLVATRQVEARARGEVGSLDARTPMAALPVDAAFVEVPNVTFAPIPPPEEEPLLTPEPPALGGVVAVQGRYGVIAGERRTVVWALALDPAAHPTAESVAPALGPLVSERAGGAPADAAEVVDRIVVAADAPLGERSARAFRHQGLVLVVEGTRPDQLDAVVTAWVTALGPG